MTDLSTTYLGHPIKRTLSSPQPHPFRKKSTGAKKLEDAGIGAIVMYSLFEEQIIHESLELDHYLSRGTETYPEALSYLPDGGLYAVRPEKYLIQVAGLKKALQHPRDRKSERCLKRRLDQLCQKDPGGRRRCPGAQPVLHLHRCQYDFQ